MRLTSERILADVAVNLDATTPLTVKAAIAVSVRSTNSTDEN